jgi:hypothetical protein
VTDKALDEAIRQSLLDVLPSWWDLPIITGNQPTPQGRTDGVYFWRIGQVMHGWGMRSFRTQGSRETIKQLVQSQYQFSVMVTPNYHMSQRTAADRLGQLHMVLSSQKFLESMRKKQVGVQRPGAMVVPTIENERGQYEVIPNFTCIFVHELTLGLETGNIESATADIKRI